MTTLAGLKSHDSILSKLDTFKRRKKERMEVEELTKESDQAIKISTNPSITNDPKDYELQEGEERSFLEKSSQHSVAVQELSEKLLTWINNELADERILVRDLQEDLYDGQILQKLVEKLANVKLDHPEVTQSEIGQIQRLKEVLLTINEFLRVPASWAAQRWSAERIHQKDLVATLRLLVALARQFKSELHFPPGIFLTVIIARKLNGKLEYRYEREYITEVTGPEAAGHPLDVLSEHHMVVQTLKAFVNTQLSQLQLEVADMATGFSDGVLLILLTGLLNGYFVPFHAYHPTPTTEAMRVHNVKLAFELMQASGLAEPPAQPEEIVAADHKAILRVLYNIYSHHQRMEDERRYEIDNIRELDEPEETAVVVSPGETRANMF
ncbi:Alpha-parvin [Fasciola gigantica]|uniref:Alpha-parvin n=1 Tax=Fasciola gigantica TaxID=46835 RepID=A0A504Y579_FASGI|nr:Alpha-parvin [Fasciola gigantica]